MRLPSLIMLSLLVMAIGFGCSPPNSTPSPAPTAAVTQPETPEAHHGGGMNQMLEQLNLTPEQKQKIEEIRKAHGDDRRGAFKEIREVLTPEQRDKLKSMRGQHHHRHHDDSPAPAPADTPSDE